MPPTVPDGYMTDRAERLSTTLPSNLVAELDAVVDEWGYASRSKAVRDALRAFLAERDWRENVDGHHRGSITIVYDHDAPGVNDALLEVQHDCGAVIVATQHVHFDEHRCLETVVVDGPGTAIRDLVQGIESITGVKQVQFTVV